MEERADYIAAPCSRFACRACRTKAGWPHQSWCPLAGRTSVGCGDCRYWSPEKGDCRHPAERKGGDAI